MSPSSNSKHLADLLSNSVKAGIGNQKKAAVLFSGGVDSAILAVLAREFAETELYVAGYPGSPDLLWGKDAAELLAMPVHEIKIDEEMMIAATRKIVRDVGMTKARWLTPFIPLFIGIESAKEEVVLCGQGADELFGGYQKYVREGAVEAQSQMSKDLEELRSEEAIYYHKIADLFSKRLAMPFLDDEIIKFGAGLPFDEKIRGGETKVILRKAAKHLAIPEPIASKKKKAIQYGTHVSRELKRYLKRRKLTLDDFISDL